MWLLSLSPFTPLLFSFPEEGLNLVKRGAQSHAAPLATNFSGNTNSERHMRIRNVFSQLTILSMFYKPRFQILSQFYSAVKVKKVQILFMSIYYYQDTH